MIIHIDAEFKRLIPALLPDEFKQLESNILQDDEIKEPLAIWKTPEGNTLLDGHNRYKIAEKHNIKFLTTEITLTDRDHAKLWILNHQLGRRNLPIGVRTALVSDVARIEEEIRRKEHSAKAGLQVSEKARLARPNTGAKKTPMLPSAKSIKSKTYEAAAKRGGVPTNAIRQFRSIETKAPEIAQKVRMGELTPTEGTKLASLAVPAQKIALAAISNGTDVRAAIRAAKKEDYNATIALTKPKELEGTYRIIYADPPWKYVGLNQADEYGHAERHYDCLDDDQLKKYKVGGTRSVKEITDKNAVLFLWVTSPLLERCFAIIDAWGFKYKSSFVWDKVKHNMGHYNSVRHELLLIATKNSCKPDVSKLVDSVQSIERSNKHSEKPEEFRTIIDNLYDHGRRLELFRRGEAPKGWDIDGNETAE